MSDEDILQTILRLRRCPLPLRHLPLKTDTQAVSYGAKRTHRAEERSGAGTGGLERNSISLGAATEMEGWRFVGRASSRATQSVRNIREH